MSGKEDTCQCRRYKRGEVNPWLGKIFWRRKWQPTPVILPEESQRQRSLAGYSSGGHKESDTTERTWHACTAYFWCMTSHSWFFVCQLEPASLLPRHGNGPSELGGANVREGAESALHACSFGTEIVGAQSAPSINALSPRGSQGPVILTEPVGRSSA